MRVADGRPGDERQVDLGRMGSLYDPTTDRTRLCPDLHRVPEPADNSHDAEIRKLLRVELLFIDDFALSLSTPPTPPTLYDLIVERPRSAATVVTSNREPVEWLA